jgi:hypothetical protein
MAGLLPATSPSFIPKSESVSNLTNGYGFEAFGAGYPEAAQPRYITTGASIPQSPNLTEEGCLKTEALPVSERASSGYSRILVVLSYKAPGFCKPGGSITCSACRKSSNAFSDPFFAG